MAPKGWFAIAGWSLVALSIELFIGFGFAFNPGWANGWPFGLTIYLVWPTGMSILLLMLLMTAAVGVGACVGASCSCRGIGLRHGRTVYAAWLVICCLLATAASVRAFLSLYASTLEMWPDGYGL